MTRSSQPAAGVAEPRLLGRWAVGATMIGVVSITAGLAFGYDQGVIGGALTFMQQDFGFSSFVEGVITSWVTIGALVGALAGGPLADRYSRTRTLIGAAGLLVLGGLVQAAAPGVVVLVVGRFVIGFGVGVASVAAPMYVAESSPHELRGRYVSAYQLAITIGIFVAQLVDLVLSDSGAWRAMLGLAAVAGLLLLLAVYPAPHSPRWLVSVGRRDEAARAIRRVRGPDTTVDLDGQLEEIERNLEAEPTSSWGDLLVGAARGALVVAVGLALVQQITGINAIIYYSDDILQNAGFDTPSAQAEASLLAVGLVNVLATLIALAFIDRLGRRPLLFAGMTGMFVGLAGLTITFLYPTPTGDTHTVAGSLSVISMVVFIGSFAFSLGPIVWTIIAEVFPQAVRAKGMSAATAVNWGAAFLLTLFFPDLIDWIGSSATFGLLAALTAISLVWVWRKVPETKGKMLEEITALFEPGADDRGASPTVEAGG